MTWLEVKIRDTHRVVLAKIGRWLAAEHADITGPADWTRHTCTAWIAAVDRMRVGDHIQSQNWRNRRPEQLGKPLSPMTKRTYIRIARTFFRDIQDWDWIPRRFDPAQALETPRSIRALQGPDPRVIADDLWDKLLGPQPQLRPRRRSRQDAVGGDIGSWLAVPRLGCQACP